MTEPKQSKEITQKIRILRGVISAGSLGNRLNNLEIFCTVFWAKSAILQFLVFIFIQGIYTCHELMSTIIIAFEHVKASTSWRE